MLRGNNDDAYKMVDDSITNAPSGINYCSSPRENLIEDDHEEHRSEVKTNIVCFQMIPYLDKEARDNIKTFKYQGGDNGFLYHLFYNPSAKWLVEKIPRWIAPNVVSTPKFDLKF